MDSMVITSKFTTELISKLITKMVSKKLGYDLKIDIDKVAMAVTNDDVKAHLEIDGMMPRKEFAKIVKEELL